MKQKIGTARQTIANVLDQGIPVSFAYSGGKDSSAGLALLLDVACSHPACPPIYVTHADTMIENPEIAQYVRKELNKLEIFAADHNLPLTIEIAYPSLGSQWVVKVIGGRALPSFPGANRDCSWDMKISPQNRLRKKLRRSLGSYVTIICTRFDESSSRKERMVERGEVADQIWTNDKGEMFLSPIADWSTQDVWTLLGLFRDQECTFSDFSKIFQLYTDANEDRHETSLLGNKTKPLGSRFGCFLCCATQDKSLQRMIQKNPKRYGYMKGLNDLQQFLMTTQYDLDRRDWFGRTIDENGYIAIAPDVYSPAMLEELLCYCLTLDVREMEASIGAGLYHPRFQLITAEALIAIDAMWSLHGRHKAHHALYLYDQVYNQGKRFDIPKIDTTKLPTKMPAPVYYHVGEAWEQNLEAGLRDTTLELAAGGDSYCMGTKELKNGILVMDCETKDCFSVDTEAAWFILDPDMGMLSDYLKTHDTGHTMASTAYTTYVLLGTVQIAKGKEWVIDKILKRSNWKERNGLGPGVDYRDILKKCVSKNARKHELVDGPRQLNLFDVIGDVEVEHGKAA